MSSILDFSETASAIGSVSHLDDSELTVATRALTPSSSSTPSISRPKTSPVWEYCRIEEGKTTPAAWVDSNGTKWWHCQPCFDKKREKKYNLLRQEIRREVTQNRLGDITAFLANEKQHSSKKRKATAEADALDQATLRELYCRYTVACSLPFAHVEQPAFRDFIRYICPAADDFLPRSGDTIKNDLQWGYDNKKEFVKRAPQNALSSIHIVPDNWISPNCLGVIGFTVQFVTEDHGPAVPCEAIMEFIREYGIASKVGYFMMDNATNMNTMIDKVSDDLEHEFDVFYDPLPHRLRSFGHIVNLAVMEFLIGKRPPTTDSYRGPSDEEVEQWRKRGAIGKLHHIVVYVMWTPQRLQTFTALSDGLRLRRDNDTHWNSWYKMVEWVLRPKVRQAITIICAQEPALQGDVLTSSDWVTLAETHKFLEPFHDATTANEGMGDSISDVLPTMDYLLHHIEAAKKATTLPHLATMMETAWAKLADYYELTEDSPVYSAATVLHPSLKWAYMEKTWEDRNEWIEKAKARVGELWRVTYKSTTSSCPIFRPSSAQGPSIGRPNGYKVWMKEQKATIFNMDDDEYEVYCREPVLMVSDPLKWWLESAQRRRFPNLSMMAIDILPIAPMSTEIERLFSKAKLTVTDQRGSMNTETLNLLECLRSWDRSTLIVPSECCYVDPEATGAISDGYDSEREKEGGREDISTTALGGLDVTHEGG
ncbi:Zinc finger BED domain-containing protein DAYSLEEPER [Fusarium oxysporum f. sp. raphani]|uniref:Zinc finger BED domain-containing protein DAYSLEEPER n=1 Tax=Fusarium oxysporum f. sp. raphani TaxID=96318 RepID=A0A8J5NQG0_FUSOX|nr:Zinc finger BED domain-containing protein DAYSLEEPER [Fusarium oxysporum f. sp. raphani]